MATATFIHDGAAIDYKPGTNILAGGIVVQNDLVGVAKQPIAANALGALAVEGVFDFPKAVGGGTAIGAGKKVWWDTVNEVVTDQEPGGGAGKNFGKTVMAAGDNDATVRVRLSQ